MLLSAQPSRPDMAALSDEELVLVARGDDSRLALRELVARHYPKLEIIVAGWARAWRLSDADREEAGQQAVLGLEEAIVRYNPDLPAAREKGRFRTYLVRIVWHRFIDCMRTARRRARRMERSVRMEDLPDRSTGSQRGGGGRDPVALVILLELQVRIAAAFRDLDNRARETAKTLGTDRRLQDLADALGLTYPQAKRLRRQFRVQLANHLKDWKD